MKANTYVSLLRGINVGGQKKILMEDLKAVFEQMNFRQVITYIQSGNVIFTSHENDEDNSLALSIESALERKYGFFVPTIVRSAEEMRQILAKNPFLHDPAINQDKLHITFLDNKPLGANVESTAKLDFSPDRFLILDKDVFVYCPEGYGSTKINNSFFESRLKVSATTRNWKTMVKLAGIASMNDKG